MELVRGRHRTGISRLHRDEVRPVPTAKSTPSTYYQPPLGVEHKDASSTWPPTHPGYGSSIRV
ncbi:hypothetical protein [Corynebacterium amycolatum]|uniref:hypothetical protein n=1 Tax=Corynebacterium amycolatum TaxID=43765 RepID=UPI002119BFA3|nr:hypothetical protein [Corynebacterium amycolatum]